MNKNNYGYISMTYATCTKKAVIFTIQSFGLDVIKNQGNVYYYNNQKHACILDN